MDQSVGKELAGCDHIQRVTGNGLMLRWRPMIGGFPRESTLGLVLLRSGASSIRQSWICWRKSTEGPQR